MGQRKHSGQQSTALSLSLSLARPRFPSFVPLRHCRLTDQSRRHTSEGDPWSTLAQHDARTESFGLVPPSKLESVIEAGLASKSKEENRDKSAVEHNVHLCTEFHVVRVRQAQGCVTRLRSQRPRQDGVAAAAALAELHSGSSR